MQYVGISTYQFIPYYASAIHAHTHTRILKPFEDSEPTGLKVDIAVKSFETHFGLRVVRSTLMLFSRHFSSQNISVKRHCPPPISVCTLCLRACIRACVRACVRACACVCVCVCVCVYVCVCMCACVCVDIHTAVVCLVCWGGKDGGKKAYPVK